MIINKNINALKTEGNLKRVNEKNAKALEKLSSGLKINRAADDSAGLAISEKMRAQIRGLNQASRNLQDGISLVQTADGALGNVHDILKRGKELCVQAANDTNTQEDRQIINEELKQLHQQIDKIGTDTEFNTIKIFTEGAAANTEEEMFLMIAEVWVASALDAIYTTFPIFAAAGSGKQMQLVFEDSSTMGAGVMASLGASGNPLAAAPNSFKLTINKDYFDPAKIYKFNNSGGGDAVTASELYDKIIAHEMMHGVMFDTIWSGMTNGDMPSWFIEGAAEAVGGGFYRIAGKNVAAIQNDLLTQPYSSGYAASLYLGYLAGGSNMNDITAGLNLVLTELVNGSTFDDALLATTGMNKAQFEAKFVDLADTDVSDFITTLKTTVSAAGGSGSVLQPTPITTSPQDTIWDTKYPDISANNFIISSLPVTENAALIIHSGANSDQHIKVNRFGLSSAKLGLPTESSLGTRSSYDKAIQSYDAAINTVSNMRSYYGAIQNRMEYAMENADNYAENLQAAESRIRDADMSLTMMEFTKTNILSQSAMAMLAQANQMPQNILTLLR